MGKDIAGRIRMGKGMEVGRLLLMFGTPLFLQIRSNAAFLQVSPEPRMVPGTQTDAYQLHFEPRGDKGGKLRAESFRGSCPTCQAGSTHEVLCDLRCIV